MEENLIQQEDGVNKLFKSSPGGLCLKENKDINIRQIAKQMNSSKFT